jgi:hypothetical protein
MALDALLDHLLRDAVSAEALQHLRNQFVGNLDLRGQRGFALPDSRFDTCKPWRSQCKGTFRRAGRNEPGNVPIWLGSL